MNDDVLNISLGDSVITVTINSIDIKAVNVKHDKIAQKVVLNCSNGSSEKLQAVDEAWVKQKTGSYENKGLWLTVAEDGKLSIPPMSALGKIMLMYNAEQLKDLVNIKVRGIYKSNGFLALLTEPYDKSKEYTSR